MRPSEALSRHRTRILEIAARHHVGNVRVFGSVLRGEDGPGSDLDLLAEQQAALLAVAYEGDYGRPTCASCGTKMVERNSSRNAGSFWGCANYPKCRGRTIPKAKASAMV